jgi:hypothetical protein
MSEVCRGPTKAGSFETSTQAPYSQRPSEESLRDALFGWILPSPRVSTPLRSAFAVSHDLDGLPLLRLPDVFQPETLLGFGLLLE